MIGKIKSLIDAEKNIDEIAKKTENNSALLQEQSNIIKELKHEIISLTKELKKLSSSAETHSEVAKSHIAHVASTKKAMDEELYELKLVKQQFQTKLIEELLYAFKEEMKKQTGSLDTDIKRFNELKSEVGTVSKELTNATSEIDKFVKISRKIKEADFDLVKHNKNIDNGKKEKDELIKRIDYLETLIAKERRKNR